MCFEFGDLWFCFVPGYLKLVSKLVFAFHLWLTCDDLVIPICGWVFRLCRLVFFCGLIWVILLDASFWGLGVECLILLVFCLGWIGLNRYFGFLFWRFVLVGLFGFG